MASSRTLNLPGATLEKIRRALGPMDDVEAFPQVAHRALACLSNSRSSSAELAAILSTDQMLAGRLVGAANSAYYRGNHRFTTVHEAVVRLGYRAVRELLLVASFADAFQRPLKLYNLIGDEMWTHALATAVAARVVAERTRLCYPDDAYLAGLLHDVGRVAMARSLDRACAQAVSELTLSSQMPFHQAESRILGFTHAEVGSLVLRNWGISDELASVVAAHHDGVVEAGPLAWVVHVADVLAVMAAPPACTSGWLWTVDAGVAERVGLQRWLSEGERASLDLDALFEEIRQGVTTAANLIDPRNTSSTGR